LRAKVDACAAAVRTEDPGATVDAVGDGIGVCVESAAAFLLRFLDRVSSAAKISFSGHLRTSDVWFLLRSGIRP
jgi:hypothetical protein